MQRWTKRSVMRAAVSQVPLGTEVVFDFTWGSRIVSIVEYQELPRDVIWDNARGDRLEVYGESVDGKAGVMHLTLQELSMRVVRSE